MDHDRNKILVYFLILICFTGCAEKSPEDLLVNLIENKYANLYVNNESQKRTALEELKAYLKDHKINDENLNEIKTRLHKLNDGHVVLFDDRKEKNIRYNSSIVFTPGSNLVKSCRECKPEVKNDSWEIISINGLPLSQYLENNKYSIAASTEWGREYRIIRQLQENSYKADILLELKSPKGKLVETQLTWKQIVPSTPDCVRGVRMSENVFKVVISSLWCQDTSKGEQDRLLIYENFRNQFDQAMSAANDKDHIVLDLRENGGGGDYEVEYVLNAFFPKSVFMYHYKYLRKTHPGKRKHLEKYWPFKLDVWSKDEFQYTDLSHKPKRLFLDNTVSTLISPGCFSSCETIASTLKMEKRSKTYGTKTHGGSGDPVIFPLEGTPFSLNLTTCVTWQENNEFFEGVGVSPDQEVLQSKKSLNDDVIIAATGLTQ